MSNILATKLHRPSLPSRRVQRPLLNKRLDEGLASGRQITLVSAPAGFGKSTCVSEWVKGLDIPVAWLSLNASDDDPGRFFTYFVAALLKIDKNLGQDIEGILRAGQLPPGEIISTTLINDILDMEDRFLLVLGDFQVIQDPFILEVLEVLVANLPQPLHLVLLTREDPSLPLARLRANNQMTEIRAGDLRFTNREAEHFLTEVMNLSLTQADIAALEERTEGWVVGLQLVAIAMQTPLTNQARSNQSNLIATLSGSHQFILSYLTEEVLNQQPEEIQHFLLQTSILDRLSGDLCDEVTSRTDSHALLEQLYKANLFLVPLDDEQQWYRYHQLFADLLRDQQTTRRKDETAGLHRRASHWFVQAGMVNEAIQHALAATDYATAIQLIESHTMDMVMQWHIKTLDGWVQSIPQEWISQSPEANLAFAWIHLMRGSYEQAAPYLVRLQAMFTGSEEQQIIGSAMEPQIGEEDPSLKAKWLTLQSMLMNAQRKPAESLVLAKQALEIVPEEDGHVRNMLYLRLADAYQQLDDYELSLEAY